MPDAVNGPTPPIVVISRCLGFEACRWDGGIISDEFAEALKPHLDCRPVCPEKEIGLGVPRDPIRIERERGALRLVQPAAGRDVTAEMLGFCAFFLGSLGEVDGFLLKSRSPSCGTADVKVFPGDGRPDPAATGAGFFAGAAVSRHPRLAVESEEGLRDVRIRERFLTRLFSSARFRAVSKGGSMSDLADFHARNRYLIMSCSRAELKRMDAIVANRDRRPPSEVMPLYGERLSLALSRPPRSASNIAVLMRALDHLSRHLTPREKSRFLADLERYRDGAIPLSAALSAVNAWIVRFDQVHLGRQTFFRPYPRELTPRGGSGKGRDL